MSALPSVLHILSQRPSLTGSGVTLDALVQQARLRGWQQQVVVGTPVAAPRPRVGSLPVSRIHPLLFDRAPLDFPVPGMSDVMPYRSTRFSAMTRPQIDRYRSAWTEHLENIIRRSRPTVIHSHHLWIVSSILKDIAPNIPVVTQCHATAFRQMELCPDLAEEVRLGCARNDQFVVLHRGHRHEVAKMLAVSSERVHVVGAGYRPDLFHASNSTKTGNRLAYAGKFSISKGLPQLLDAFQRLRASRPDIELHVAGSGSGEEAEAIARRMKTMSGVFEHGRLDQRELAELMRTADVFVLPSFYEGVPLVLVEAAACGCRLVATDLPGVSGQLAPALGDALRRVKLPRLRTVDQPDPDDLPEFVEALTEALDRSLAEAARVSAPRLSHALEELFSWAAVFQRVERVWRLATDSAV